MNRAILLIIITLFTFQAGVTQNGEKTGSIAVMVAVVGSESMDSIPLKISIDKSSQNESELTLSPSNMENEGMILLGIPYRTKNLQIPSEQIVTNQFGQTARVKNFQLIYGDSEDKAGTEVVPPGPCSELMIPETGHLFIRIGATITSESKLKGVYTGSFDFECNAE